MHLTSLKSRPGRPKHEPARAAILSLLILVAACSSPEQRAADAANTAQQLFAQRDFRNAAIEINKALGLRDDVAEYWVLLARTEIELGNYAGAYSAYTRAMELDRSNLEALYSVAELAFAGGQVDDADDYADQLLALNPQDVRALLVKGSVALKRKQYADAAKFADTVIAAEPANEGGTLLKARSLAATGKGAEGAALLETTMKTRGESVGMLLGVLELYKEIGDRPAIARSYARLFKLAPQNIDLQIDYARELYRSGNARQAFAVVERMQKAKPDDAELQGRIVDLWLEVGGRAIAIDEIRRLAAQGSPTMKVALARYALEDGYPAEAERLLRPFVDKGAISPENVEANALYAMTQNALGNTSEALVRATRVLDFDDANPKALLLRAQIAVARRDYDRALIDAQVLARDNPKMASTRAILAQIYALRGEKQLADAAFRKAIQDIPDSPEILSNYVNFLMGANRREDALRLAANFTKDNPELVQGWKVRADLCIKVGDTACAENALAALRTLRGGNRAERELSVMFEARKRESADVSGSLRGIADKILADKASLVSTVRQLIAGGRAKDAEAVVRFIIARQPQNSLAHVVLANILLSRGAGRDAEKMLAGLIQRFPDEPRAYSDLAAIKLRSGDRAGAFALMDQGLARLKGNRVLLKDLAGMQELAGEPQRAIVTYRTLLRDDPSDLLVVNNLASLLTDYGKPPAAYAEAGLLTERLATFNIPVFFDTRGWLLLKMGKREEALPLLRRAAESRGAPIFNYHLAEALAAKGDRGGARAQAQLALEAAHPNDRWVGKVRNLLGRL